MLYGSGGQSIISQSLKIPSVSCKTLSIDLSCMKLYSNSIWASFAWLISFSFTYSWFLVFPQDLSSVTVFKISLVCSRFLSKLSLIVCNCFFNTDFINFNLLVSVWSCSEFFVRDFAFLYEPASVAFCFSLTASSETYFILD